MSEDDGSRWWHNLPRCNVGDLVAYKRRDGKRFPLLVVSVHPVHPCRAPPCQGVTCVDSKGNEKTFNAARLEVISESR